MASRSVAKDSPDGSAWSPAGLVIWWTQGSGLSIVTRVSTGAASVTVRPSRISLAAAITWACVMLFSAPRRSSVPQEAALRNRWYRALKAASSSTCRCLGRPGLVIEAGGLLVEGRGDSAWGLKPLVPAPRPHPAITRPIGPRPRLGSGHGHGALPGSARPASQAWRGARSGPPDPAAVRAAPSRLAPRTR